MAEAGAEDLARLRDRKQQRERVEAAVRQAVARFTFDEAAARLKAAGLGFNEVLPLERVLDAPQARQPGKLREVEFRGLHFEVPEFPGGGSPAGVGLPPPEIGEHTLELLRSFGYSDAQCTALFEQGAAKPFAQGDFAWAPVRQKA
jgi:crotonobetainyl-CoA:carnitine CoA-transferase CaiB-like acyl-CoA transferase